MAPSDPLQGVAGLDGEQLALGPRALYVHYGDGMADSKLRIPCAADGTARNLNTVTKLVMMAARLA